MSEQANMEIQEHERKSSEPACLPWHKSEPERIIQRYLYNTRPAMSDLPDRTFKASLIAAVHFLHDLLQQSDNPDLIQALRLVESELQNLTRLEQARGMVLQA